MGRIVGTPKLARDRKRPRGGNFYIYWTDSERGSCEKSTGHGEFSAAKQVFDRWWQLNRGNLMPRGTDEVSVNEVLDHYRCVQQPKVQAPQRMDHASAALLSYWDGKSVAAVNRHACLDYEHLRQSAHRTRWPGRETLSPNTVRRELTVLRAALAVARKDNLIDRDVTVFLPAEVPSNVVQFSCAEAIGLLRLAWRVRRARHHLRLFLLIGFLTGRRKEAILSLKWSDIDFTSGVITWNPEGRPITNKARPLGAIPNRLRKHLLRHRRRFPDDEYVISCKGQSIADIKTAFAAVVRLYRAEQRRRLIQGGMTEADAARVPIMPQAHPHMMRHSCATWLMQKGIEPRAACEFLGMSAETLSRRYYHHHPDYQRGPANAF